MVTVRQPKTIIDRMTADLSDDALRAGVRAPAEL